MTPVGPPHQSPLRCMSEDTWWGHGWCWIFRGSSGVGSPFWSSSWSGWFWRNPPLSASVTYGAFFSHTISARWPHSWRASPVPGSSLWLDGRWCCRSGPLLEEPTGRTCSWFWWNGGALWSAESVGIFSPDWPWYHHFQWKIPRFPGVWPSLQTLRFWILCPCHFGRVAGHVRPHPVCPRRLHWLPFQSFLSVFWPRRTWRRHPQHITRTWHHRFLSCKHSRPPGYTGIGQRALTQSLFVWEISFSLVGAMCRPVPPVGLSLSSLWSTFSPSEGTQKGPDSGVGCRLTQPPVTPQEGFIPPLPLLILFPGQLSLAHSQKGLLLPLLLERGVVGYSVTSFLLLPCAAVAL